MKSGAVALILLILLCGLATALPNAPTIGMIGSNNVTFTNVGASSPCWYIWGPANNGKELWKTPNRTAVAGICTATIQGFPLNANSKYFVQSCDITGNSTDSTFTTAAITLNPKTTYGNVYQNVTETGFSPLFIMANTLAPYVWVSPMSFIWGFLFLIVYVGYWIRGRGVIIPALLGFCTGSLFLYSGMGLNLGIPLEFTAIAQGIAYASLAGIILGLIKK